jgi:membrane protease YdiL (CAAX protease family)
MPIREFISRHVLLSYVFLVFAISWGGILLVISHGGFVPSGAESEQRFLIMYLAMLAGPSVGGLVVAGVVYGRAGLRNLLSRLRRWRVGARWYAAAFLIAPSVMAAVLLLLSRVSPQFLPRLLGPEDRAFLIQFSLVAALLVGVFEEVGWTGLATEALLRRGYGLLRAGLVIGLLFAAWDSLIVYLMSGTPAGAGGLSLAVYLPAVLFTWLPTYRVLMVWVYDRTGSLLVAILMHVSLIAFWRILTPLTISGLSLVAFYLLVTAAFWIVIAVVAAYNGWKLPSKRSRARQTERRTGAEVAAPTAVPD